MNFYEAVHDTVSGHVQPIVFKLAILDD